MEEEKEETLTDLFMQVTHPQNLGTSAVFLEGLSRAAVGSQTGQLAKFVRKLGQKPEEIETFEQAKQFGSQIQQDGRFEEAYKDTRMVQGMLRPFGKLGENIQANIAKRTKEGVCQDAACVLDQYVKEVGAKGEVVSGTLRESDGSGSHALNLVQDNEGSIYVVDSARPYIEQKIEAKTLKEARRVLEKGIEGQGFSFQAKRKGKRFPK